VGVERRRPREETKAGPGQRHGKEEADGPGEGRGKTKPTGPGEEDGQGETGGDRREGETGGDRREGETGEKEKPAGASLATFGRRARRGQPSGRIGRMNRRGYDLGGSKGEVGGDQAIWPDRQEGVPATPGRERGGLARASWLKNLVGGRAGQAALPWLIGGPENEAGVCNKAHRDRERNAGTDPCRDVVERRADRGPKRQADTDGSPPFHGRVRWDGDA
jgi:hypothetical protein